MKQRVLIADDHAILRDGLRSLVQNELGFDVVAEAEEGKTALTLARELCPDLIILDINMPGMNGIESARNILRDVPLAKIIILSMHREKRYVIEMFAIGVSAYLVKDSAFKELAEAINAVTRHKRYVSPSLGADVIQECLDRLAQRLTPEKPILTPKEREVLQLIAEGKTTPAIAGFLNISVKTVDNHRQRIMEKLDIHTVAELTKYAIREGISSLDR